MSANKKYMAASMFAVTSLALVSLSPSSAQEVGEAMYERYYYDDPGMTIAVGYERDTCTSSGVGSGPTEGRYGPYVQENIIARCGPGGQIYPY